MRSHGAVPGVPAAGCIGKDPGHRGRPAGQTWQVSVARGTDSWHRMGYGHSLGLDVACRQGRPGGQRARGWGAGGSPGMIPPLIVWFPKWEEKLRFSHPHDACHSNGFPFLHSKISFPGNLYAHPRIAICLPLEPLTWHSPSPGIPLTWHSPSHLLS